MHLEVNNSSISKKDVSDDEISMTEWIARNLPGSVIESVSGEGACLLESLSYILWQTREHYKTLGRAISKYIIKNYDNLEASNMIYYPLTRLCRKISNEELIFQNKEEFKNFLNSEESIWTYREGPDLLILSNLLEIQINVLVSKNSKMVDSGKHTVFGEEYKRRAYVLFNVDEMHYSPVVTPHDTNDNFTLLNNVERYVDCHSEPKKEDRTPEEWLAEKMSSAGAKIKKRSNSIPKKSIKRSRSSMKIKSASAGKLVRDARGRFAEKFQGYPKEVDEKVKV